MVGIFGFDSSLLAGWYTAKNTLAASRTAALTAPAAASGGGATGTKTNIVPPWDTQATPAGLEELARSALADGVFFKNGEFKGLKATEDTEDMFALHQGLKRLYALATEAADKSTNDVRRAFLERRFQEGLTQFESYLGKLDFKTLSLVRGDVRLSMESGTKISRGVSEYVTPVIHEGAFDAEVEAFLGAAAFTIAVTRNGVTTPVEIDLNNMGATPRTLDNVADFINTQLEAAGALSRISRVKIGEKDEHGVIPGNNFGFKITGISTEKLTFSAASGAASLYIAGVSGADENAAGQLTKLNNLGATPETQFITRLEADPAPALNDKGEAITKPVGMRAKATALGPNGELYVLAETDGATDGMAIRGETDLVLMKYDSTGQQAWSRVLGAADTAAAADLAVDADGSVIVTGKITGDLGQTIDRKGSDAFVAKYSATGGEMWLQRFGTGADDAPSSIALGAGGEIYVGGATGGALGAAMLGGGKDGFVRALDADGATLWTRQVGGAGADGVTALAVADDGSLLVGETRDGAGVLTKYSAADGVSAAIWTHNLGAMNGGQLAGIAVEGGAIYLTGAAGEASDLAGGNPGHAGGSDAFLMRLDDAGANATEVFTTFLGTDSDDRARDIVVHNGAVYLTGKTGGELPGGATQIGDRNSFAAKLNGATGALDWTTQISGWNGLSEAFSIAVDPAGDSVLDAFGLPRGTLDYGGGSLLTERTALHAGDHFYISVDGGRKRKITIEAKDTYLSLSFKINAALVLDGRAQVSRSSKGDALRIKPLGDAVIEIFAGDDGRDALNALGLKPGAVRNTPDPDKSSASDAPPLYALGMPASLSIGEKGDATAAMEALDKAMTVIRRAYRELNTDPAITELLNRKQAGPPPPYLAAQLANFEAGLARLSAGADPASMLI